MLPARRRRCDRVASLSEPDGVRGSCGRGGGAERALGANRSRRGATLAELSVDLPRTTIDLRCFPSLDTLHIVGEYDELIDVMGIASLSKLKELTVYYTILENARAARGPHRARALDLGQRHFEGDLSFIWKLTSLRQLTDFDPLDISGNLEPPYYEAGSTLSPALPGDLSPLSQADKLEGTPRQPESPA